MFVLCTYEFDFFSALFFAPLKNYSCTKCLPLKTDNTWYKTLTPLIAVVSKGGGVVHINRRRRRRDDDDENICC